MTDVTNQVARFVDALVRNRRPPRFRLEAPEGEALPTAAMLRGATLGGEGPDPAFVERLHAKLARSVERSDEPAVTRRRLLMRLGIPSAAALFGAAAGAVLREAAEQFPQESSVTEMVPSEVGVWTPVSALSALGAGQPLTFTVGAIRGFLIRQADGDVIAVSAVCTHLGCLLSADPQSSRLKCPCHGAAFAFDGAPMDPRYTTPLPRLRARVVDGTIEVFAV
jgi:cytochrome b6-f complex iron-sulfur subunit